MGTASHLFVKFWGFALHSFDIDLNCIRHELNKDKTEVCADIMPFNGIVKNCKIKLYKKYGYENVI